MGNRNIKLNYNKMDIQKNERLISPVSIWRPAGTIEMNLIRIDNFQNYFFDGGDGQVHWVMFTAIDQPAVAAIAGNGDMPPIPAQDALTVKNPIIDGYVNIPADVLSEWANDDEVIFNYVLGDLKLMEVKSA